jgi:hypothetical protein
MEGQRETQGMYKVERKGDKREEGRKDKRERRCNSLDFVINSSQ